MKSVLFVLILLSQIAQANVRLQGSVPTKEAGAILSFVPGSIENMRQPIINDLVSTDMPKLDPPNFPRFWTERTKSEIVVSTTKLSAKIPVVDLGAKLNMEFRFGLKTSFVMISSKRKSEKGHSKKPVAKSVILANEDDEVLVMDESTFLSYPNVRPGYPMVGFCVFEASLSMEKTMEGGFNFIVEETNKRGSVETMSNAIFSNFFQVRGDVPVSTYLDGVCRGIFKKEVETVVVNDFSKLVIEKLVSQNPKSDCSPSRPTEEDIVNGDQSCQEWHATNFSAPVRHLTVPRCMLQANGVHRCRLKARAGTACNMYLDPATMQYSETFKSFDRTVLATEEHYAYSCDKKANLSCVLEKEPILLRGLPIYSGKARCQSSEK